MDLNPEFVANLINSYILCQQQNLVTHQKLDALEQKIDLVLSQHNHDQHDDLSSLTSHDIQFTNNNNPSNIEHLATLFIQHNLVKGHNFILNKAFLKNAFKTWAHDNHHDLTECTDYRISVVFDTLLGPPRTRSKKTNDLELYNILTNQQLEHIPGHSCTLKVNPGYKGFALKSLPSVYIPN